ncbi:MAG TPA: esterase-like activity of phytase family protein [Gemmataceae bacterium]|nr:esterase-like activity of phytase family protein [Gemmataceae bacterium]
MLPFRAIVSLVAILVLDARAPADVVFLAKTSFAGDSIDRSGLSGPLEDGTPQNRLGGPGSAIAYSGKGNRFIMVADRGPADGTVSFQCRMHFLDIVVKSAGRPEMKASLRGTVLLKDEEGRSFLGIASAFDPARPAASLRLDPEGVRVGRDGSIFISDEYGPYLYQFAANGKRLRSIRIPEKFQIVNPRAKKEDELKANKSGRVPNKGMEGLAITPDGRKLVAALQAPLIQDGGCAGINCYLVEIDLAKGTSREFLYPLGKAGLGLSEILAVNDHEFLVIERDGKRGKEARDKKIVRIDIAKATDISDRASLPMKGLPKGVVAVKKELFLDLLDPRHGLVGPDFPAKLEGLAFGPDLPDGRHLLLVTTDNDFDAKEPTHLFAFAIDRGDLDLGP